MFEPVSIVVFESLNCPQCQKHTVTAGKGSNMQKILDLQDMQDFSEEQSSVLTVQNKQGTHEQPSLLFY